MEKLVSDLKMSEAKQSSLGQAYESLHSQASSLFQFTLQWKELEDHFDSTRNELQTRLRELDNREKKIDDREKRLEGLELKFYSEMASKAEELQTKRKEVESGEQHLASIKLLIEEYSEELEGKEKRFSEVERVIREKERECDSVDKRIRERTKKWNWVLKCVEDGSKEVESKKEEVRGVEEVLNEIRKDVEVKERDLNSITGLIEEGKNVYALIEENIKLENERLSLIRGSVEEWHEEMRSKKEELTLIHRSLVECSNTLESRENMIRELELKLRDFYVLKKSMEEWSNKLEFEERELEGWSEKLEMREREFEPRLEELHLIDKRINECLYEVQLKEERFDSIQKWMQEHEKHLDSISHGLQMKERQLEQQAKELELKQKEFDSNPQSNEKPPKKRILKKKINILDSQERIKQLEHSPTFPLSTSIQSLINRNGRDLQLYLNEHLKKYDLLGTEISAILQASSDPAKSVLEAMQGFYPSNSVEENKECDFDFSVIRRSCILLLQELKRLSPQIDPQVREEAAKLASDWKDKMTVAVENWLEVLGFLLLLTAYELTPSYDENELQRLLVVVSQKTQTTELSRSLGISDKTPESSILTTPVKTWDPESSLAKNGTTFSSLNLQPSATTGARILQGFLNEHLNGNPSTQKEMLTALQVSSEPEKLVLDLMQTSFDQYWRKGDVGLEETFMSINIAILEELIRVSPCIGPHVKEDAMKLAEQWKANMRADTENSLESLGFLQFVATYGLLSSLDGNEIKKLLGMIYQHKQALELCRTVGFVDKIPDFIQNLIERKQLFEAVRFICTFNIIDKFPPVPLLKEYVEGARKSYRSMWRKKKSVHRKEEVVDNEIADLRAVIQCIKDYNLESDYPSKDIEIQIVQLEKIKDNWRKEAKSLATNAEQEEKSPASGAGQEEKSPASEAEQEEQAPASKGEKEEKSAASKVEQEEKKEKKRSASTSASSNYEQRQQRQNKIRRTSVPNTLPAFRPRYLQPSPSLWLNGNYGHHRNFGIPATANYGMGANFVATPNAGSHLFLPYPPRYGRHF